MMKIDKYTVLIVKEYHGTYSLQEGWEDRNGDYNPNFCKRKYGKEAPEKIVPVSVKLGDKDTAIKVAKWILGYLNADNIENANNDDVPF
jgi:hypothetical protein